MQEYINFNKLNYREYKQLTKLEQKKYIKALQTSINEIKTKILYAENFTPHKIGYYQHLLIELMNEAPPQIK